MKKDAYDYYKEVSLAHEELYFVPVRHHSPSCARALKAAMADLSPELLLIECPSDTEHLIPFLQSDAVSPPVALYTVTRDHTAGKNTASAFYPFCDYSPEWTALKIAGQKHIKVGFIDIPSSGRTAASTENQTNLLSESALAHSRYMEALGKELGCRNFNETWERLFESKRLDELENYDNYFREIYTYCALSRSSYSKEAPETKNDISREQYMIKRTKAFRGNCKGRIMVVTGGFHTPALMDYFQKNKSGSRPTEEDD